MAQSPEEWTTTRRAGLGLLVGGTVSAGTVVGSMFLRGQHMRAAAREVIPVTQEEIDLPLTQAVLDAAKSAESDITPEQSYRAREKVDMVKAVREKRDVYRNDLITEFNKSNPLRIALEWTFGVGGTLSTVLGALITHLDISRQRVIEKREDLASMVERLDTQRTS